MSQLLYLLLVLACPVMMMVMMRGMHGGHGKAADHPPAVIDATARDVRITELEREVADLRARAGTAAADEPLSAKA